MNADRTQRARPAPCRASAAPRRAAAGRALPHVGWLLLVCVAGLPVTAGSADLDGVIQATESNLQTAQASQKKVDAIVDESQQLESEYLLALKQLDGLQVYNQYMSQQINSQETELAKLAQSLGEIEDVERQILPLMFRMLGSLEEFVQLDVPFLKEEREKRVANLRSLMERADVSAAEKFRRLLEAYQIEADFGRTIETYKDTPTIDGTRIEVDMLRVGRIGLFYQTSDASRTGMWDTKTHAWTNLEGRYRNPVRQGIRMARRQQAPDLLILPVPSPEAAQAAAARPEAAQ